jgi:hypothetical protein
MEPRKEQSTEKQPFSADCQLTSWPPEAKDQKSGKRKRPPKRHSGSPSQLW